MKKFKVKEMYCNAIFSENRQHGNLISTYDNITINNSSVKLYSDSDNCFENNEFYFEDLNSAENFCEIKMTNVNHIIINDNFEMFFYEIFKYNENIEDYDLINNCDYYITYIPKYSIDQAKSEIYNYLENLSTEDLIKINNIIFENDGKKNYVDQLLEYNENQEYYFCIDEFVDFIIYNDKINYDKNINYILQNL